MKKIYIHLAILVATCSSVSFNTKASADPYIGEIMLVGYNFCPQNWLPADGALLSISNYSALFSLFGTAYGGDGISTFALPDLRGRAPIHRGTGNGLKNYNIGNTGGSEYISITLNNMPMHNHIINSTNQVGDKNGPGGDFLAVASDAGANYHDGPPNRTMDPGMVSNTGGSVPIETRSPYLTMTYCVALTGIYPSRP